MKRRAPVFIVGAPRSGTSILYRTILKHPSFAVTGDEALQLAESGLLDQLHAAPRWKAPRPPRLWRFFLQDHEVYGRFLADVHAAIGGHDEASPDAPPPWTRPVLEAFVRHAMDARSCQRLVEKTPNHIDRAEWLLDSLPAAKLLFIHRHPLDSYTSYRRRAAVDSRAQSWADLSVDEFATVYARQSSRAQRLASSHPDRFLGISYERFTSNPAQEVSHLCAFLGEAFVPTMIEEPAPDLTRSINDPHLWGAITTRTKSWSDYVDPHTAALVEDATESIARAWGYQRRTTSTTGP